VGRGKSDPSPILQEVDLVDEDSAQIQLGSGTFASPSNRRGEVFSFRFRKKLCRLKEGRVARSSCLVACSRANKLTDLASNTKVGSDAPGSTNVEVFGGRQWRLMKLSRNSSERELSG